MNPPPPSRSPPHPLSPFPCTPLTLRDSTLRHHLCRARCPVATTAISPIPTLPTNLHCRPLKISCARGNREVLSDEALMAELTREFKKLNSQTADREEALKKSRRILFAELCDSSGMRSEELRKRWRRMSEEDRWSLAKGFVEEWSACWHPLSARSAHDTQSRISP